MPPVVVLLEFLIGLDGSWKRIGMIIFPLPILILLFFNCYCTPIIPLFPFLQARSYNHTSVLSPSANKITQLLLLLCSYSSHSSDSSDPFMVTATIALRSTVPLSFTIQQLSSSQLPTSCNTSNHNFLAQILTKTRDTHRLCGLCLESQIMVRIALPK